MSSVSSIGPVLNDVFISHASEDKDAFVRPLAEALTANHLSVWYDEFSLQIGDSLTEAIDRGLASSRFGIVVLSPDFLQKRWPRRELNGLVAREMASEEPIILPVWHKVGRSDILSYSPPLADKFALTSVMGIDSLVEALVRRIRPEGSPLVVARNTLIKLGLTPPVVSDASWLDLVEIKEAEFRFPDLNNGWRWIFPLPHEVEDGAKERGENIAFTAIQLDWAEAARSSCLTQLTHPEIIHEFIRRWPGLSDAVRRHPELLALYAPQLTVPGFDEGFDDVLDALLIANDERSYQMPGYGGNPKTVDGKLPLCGDLIAWRHSALGNFVPAELSSSFCNAHTFYYSRRTHSALACLVWLLSGDSEWMPTRVRRVLIEGFRERCFWWFPDTIIHESHSAFADYISSNLRKYKPPSQRARVDLETSLRKAAIEVGISDSPSVLLQSFMDHGFCEAYFAQEAQLRESRKRK